MNKFWSFARNATEKRTDLYILDEIAARESWWSDTVTPKAFKRDLDRAEGTLYVWLDSPGGDAFAGSMIHDMLREYSASGRGKVIAMVSLAASAASVIAMAADEIRISVVGTIMIHEPWSQPAGRSSVLRAVADVLDNVRDGQVDAYARRTGQSREKILELLVGSDGNGTYMNARQAIEWGFADAIMHEYGEGEDTRPSAFLRSVTELKIASCMERNEARLRAMVELGRVPTAEVRSVALNTGLQDTLLAGMDAQRVLGALRALCAHEDAHGDFIDAVICGIRAGLRRWDEATQWGHDDPDTPEDDEADTSAQALADAIKAVEPLLM